MWNLLLAFSLVPIALALVLRWWFALRVLADVGERTCRCDLTRWQPAPGESKELFRAEQSAAAFGLKLREGAIADWKATIPKAYKSRQSALRFALAAPPLSGMVAIFAVLGGKVPFMGALAIPLAFTALAALAGILTLPAELAVIQRAIRKAQETRAFPSQDDEEAVGRCAKAWAWEHAIPPVLRWLQKA